MRRRTASEMMRSVSMSGILLHHLLEDFAGERHVHQVGDFEQAGAQTVLNVVIVVGDVVGEGRDLRLGSGEGVEAERLQRFVVAEGGGQFRRAACRR